MLPNSRIIDDMTKPSIKELHAPPPLLRNEDFDGLRSVLAEHWRDMASEAGAVVDDAKLREGRWGIPSIIQTTEKGLAKVLAGMEEVKAAPTGTAIQLASLFSPARAKMIAVTETVHASNYATLAKSCPIGVGKEKKVRVRDSPDCGKTSHGDPDKVNGQIWTIDEAAAHPSAHPFCKRRFEPIDEPEKP